MMLESFRSNVGYQQHNNVIHEKFNAIFSLNDLNTDCIWQKLGILTNPMYTYYANLLGPGTHTGYFMCLSVYIVHFPAKVFDHHIFFIQSF